MKRIYLFPRKTGFLFAQLLTFLLATVLLAQTAKMRVNGKASKSTYEFVGSNIRDDNGRICAAIKVLSDMDGFKYQSNNGVVRVDDMPGKDMVYLSPDERVLEIYESGYEPLQVILSEYGIQLHSKEVWQIKISGQPKTGDLLPVTFLVNPQDARIRIDDVSAKQGQPIDLRKGSHKLRISKEGYRSMEREINVDKTHVLFNFSLTEVELLPVNIKSMPGAAQIFINGVNRGMTDAGLWLYPGKYQLKISFPGYVEVKQDITVSENRDNTFAFTLLKNAGYLQLKVDPPDALIQMNEKTFRAGNKIALLPGEYRLRISKNGYLEQEEQLQIKLGETIARSYHLIKNTATLTLNVSPAQARVSINKEDYSRRRAAELAPGVYKIEVLAEGYYPQSETITVRRGQSLKRAFRLVQKTGNLRFSVNPIFANVVLKRNGRITQQWQGLKLLRDLPVGVYQIEALANGYSTERKEVNVTENRTGALDIRLQKGVFFTGKKRDTRRTGRLRLHIQPADASVTIDGKQVTDGYLILPVGKYKIKGRKSGYYAWSKSVTIEQNQEAGVRIVLEQKSRRKGIVRSIILPGWGQAYQEKGGRSWLYGLAYIGSGMGSFLYTQKYNTAVSDYDEIRAAYNMAVNDNEINTLRKQMDSKYSAVNAAEKTRNIFYIASASIWLINMLDVLFLPPGWGSNARLSAVPQKNGMRFGLSYSW